MTQSTAQRLRDLAPAMAAGVAGGTLFFLAWMFATHRWILTSAGFPLPADFLSFWTAGGLAAKGQALSAYDWTRMHALQRQMMGGTFDGFLGWAYPPLFFGVAVPLAGLPYAAAFLLWVSVTLALYAVLAAAIARRPAAALFACAAPVALAAIMPGQNGFLTALLIGGSLLCLEKCPVLAGILLGLLTYKPQFGLLFPIALACGGYWRVLLVAAITTALILMAGQWLLPGTLAAFLQHMPGMRADFLGAGVSGWSKLQSLYGVLRLTSLHDGAALAAQAILLLACAAGMGWLWRGPAPLALKCAALCAGALLATPYLYLYDFPVLTLAVAFLYRQRAFDRIEILALGFATLAMAAFFLTPMPSGFLAALIVGALIVRRTAQDRAASGEYRPA